MDMISDEFKSPRFLKRDLKIRPLTVHLSKDKYEGRNRFGIGTKVILAYTIF